MSDYFDRCERFEKEILATPLWKLNMRGLEEWCNECPHRNDEHGMNCIECCPIKKKLGLYG